MCHRHCGVQITLPLPRYVVYPFVWFCLPRASCEGDGPMRRSSHRWNACAFTCRQLVLLGIGLFASPDAWTRTTAAVTIEPAEVGTIVPVIVRNHLGLNLDIPIPQGSIAIRDLDASSSLLATTTITFDSAGDGTYELDASYRSSGGLVDIESLLPGLNLLGQLGGGPAALDPWVSEHTELSSGKLIWSFSDGTVITIDPNASEVEVDTASGSFLGSAPPPLHGHPATIVIENNTPGPIEAVSFTVPEPGCAPMMLVALLTGFWLRRRRGAGVA
jgi:hypothetical protein